MKIKDYLGSVRELQSQFVKINSSQLQVAAEQASQKANSDAVRVDTQLRAETNPDDSENNQARVQELKTAVSEGRYNPSSQDVAEALIRDLFA